MNHLKFTIKKYTKKMKKQIKVPGDLAPKGVKSTIKGNYSFNEVFENIFNQSRKPDPLWKHN